MSDTGLDPSRRIVGMEHDASFTLGVVEEGMVADALQPAYTLVDGVALIFSPGTGRGVRRGIADPVLGGLIPVCGIGQVVQAAMIQDEGTLIDSRQDLFPFLVHLQTFLFGAGLDMHQVVFETGRPNLVAVIELYEEKPRLAIFVEEEAVVDCAIGYDGLMDGLYEGTGWGIGCRDTDALFRGIVHVILVADVIDLRRPEPFLAVRVLLVQRQVRFPIPVMQVPGYIYGDPVCRTGPVEVIGAVFIEDEGIGYGQGKGVDRTFRKHGSSGTGGYGQDGQQKACKITFPHDAGADGENKYWEKGLD